MFVVIRVRPLADDPTRWDRRTKTVLTHKATQHDALTFVCELIAQPGQDQRCRYFVRRLGQEGTIWARSPWFTRESAPAR